MAYTGPFPLKVEQGGTGEITLVANAVLIGQNPDDIGVTNVGTTNTVLLGNTGLPPSFGAIPNGALTNSSITLTNGANITVTGSPVSLGGAATIAVSGVIPIANGGTNASSMATVDGVVYYDGTRLVTTAAGTAGQVLTSNGAGVAPTYQAGGGGGGGITSIAGDTGGAQTGPAITLTGGTANDFGTATFIGAANTITLKPNDSLNNLGWGDDSLLNITSGTGNTCVGVASGPAIQTGNFNCFFGNGAGQSVTTSNNIGIGANAITSAGTNGFNIGIGTAAGASNAADYSCFLGAQTGSNYFSTESSNILIGYNVAGTTSESNALHIGNATGTGNGQLSQAFICGIEGVDVGSVAQVVTIDADQLGSAVLTAGAGISVTPSANVITIASTATGIGNVLAMGSGATYLNFSQAGTTVYTAPYLGAASTTQAASQFITPVAGTISKLYVNVAANTSTTNTTLTAYVNSVATGVTVTITALTTGVFSDTVNTAAVSAGDLIQWVGSAATVGTVSGTASMLLA